MQERHRALLEKISAPTKVLVESGVQANYEDIYHSTNDIKYPLIGKSEPIQLYPPTIDILPNQVRDRIYSHQLIYGTVESSILLTEE
jgi:hypothetical protein